ncbi:MAG: ribonuclease III [Betaproteobacteria bacterium]|nr:MAG: ribonuclease III [Betaproteobacteria bacterium]
MASPLALPEKTLGHRFTRPELLERALTHRSYGPDHNERLEFLGDGVLGCAVAAELYERFPRLSEGKLTRLRASLVREEALAELARELGLAPLVRLGEGELMAAAEPRPSILADALEAVFGAIFIDAGYDAARQAVLAAFGPRLELLDPERAAKDAKTELQEMLQAAHRSLPLYRVTAVQGAAHRQSFEVECVVDQMSARGTGSSRQKAEQEAARAMLEKFTT